MPNSENTGNDLRPDEAPGAPQADGDGSADAGASTAAAADDGASSRQLEEQRDKYLRLAAEFDNFRKRTARERLEAAPRAQAELVKQLLEPLDDLMRFADLDPAQVDAKTVVDGVNMVERKLLKVLAAAGVTAVDPAGEPFDPNLHEAVSTEPAASEAEDHTVSRVFQVGYAANGQLLRPARVVVKQWNG